MSKKYKHGQSPVSNQNFQHASHLDHTAEYRIIKHDLIRVILLNVIYLAGVLALYFSEQKTHALSKFFEKFLNF
jgi:hypothetical protein